MLRSFTKRVGPQRMVRVRIRMVVMVMAVLIAMGVVTTVVIFAVLVGPPKRDRNAIGLASTGALALAKIAAISESFHMMVMALLG